ncbi:hypothetical protein LTR95_008259 [Oleoguttula sp. CCFEE 5521]
MNAMECGKKAAEHFSLNPGYRSLNHGLHGRYSKYVRFVYYDHIESFERRPDTFLQYEYRTYLVDESRKSLEQYLNAPAIVRLPLAVDQLASGYVEKAGAEICARVQKTMTVRWWYFSTVGNVRCSRAHEST